AEAVVDVLLVGGGRALEVGVVDPQDEPPAVAAGEEHVEESGPGAAHVDRSGGAGSHPHPDWALGHRPICYRSVVAGLLALVGGDEFKPGNEEQAALLVEAARGHGGPAFVVPTVAARGGPQQAVDNATRWFARLGLELEELHVLTRTHANDPAVAARASRGSLFYLVGGDPGHTAATLRDTSVWRSAVAAWQGGAALAGSSAGAMAMGEWTLIRDRFKGDHRRQYRPA